MTDMIGGTMQGHYMSKRLQKKFLLNTLLITVNALIFFGFALYFVLMGSTTTEFKNSRLVMQSTSDFILPILGMSAVIVLVCIGLASMYLIKHLAFFINDLFLSISLAQSTNAEWFYKMEKDMDQVLQGNLTASVEIDKKNDLYILSTKINKMKKIYSDHLRDLAKEVSSAKHSKDKSSSLKRIEDKLGFFHL